MTQRGLHGNHALPCSPVWVMQQHIILGSYSIANIICDIHFVILSHRNQGSILLCTCMLPQWQVSCQQRLKKDKICTSTPIGRNLESLTPYAYHDYTLKMIMFLSSICQRLHQPHSLLTLGINYNTHRPYTNLEDGEIVHVSVTVLTPSSLSQVLANLRTQFYLRQSPPAPGHGRITVLFCVCFCLPSMSHFVCYRSERVNVRSKVTGLLGT